MAEIIAIANQKGGVGKTTTAINLSACMASKGKKVLVIDVDPQGNTTSGFGLNKNELEHSVYELMLGEDSAKQCLASVKDIENLKLIPANVDLAGAEIDLVDETNKNFILRDAVDYIKDDFDYIIIDCPPSLSMLTINALTTADSVLIPIQCEYYALEGIAQLENTINLIHDRLNNRLHIKGVVFTMYDGRTNLSNDVVDTVKQNLKAKVYETIIPRNVRLAEAPSHGLPINLYDPKSAGSENYMKLADEVLEER